MTTPIPSPNSPRLLGREVALWLGVVNAVVAAIVGMKLVHWTPEQTSLLLSAVNAVFAVIAAIAVRPFPVPLLSAALASVLTVVAAFGVDHITSDTVTLANGVLVAVFAFLTSTRVSPEPKIDPMVPAATEPRP